MMATSKLLLLSILLSLLLSASIAGRESEERRRDEQARQCRLNRLSATRPSRRIESEGGTTELWDEDDDQFQCAGVAAMRNIIRPNCLSLPNYHPAPRLVYIERGRGLLGLSYPGCPETYQAEDASGGRQGGSEGQRGERGQQRRDQHQKVHQISQGDILLLPAGVTHYCINNGNEDLVAISVTDLENSANQLDNSRLRQFYLAGGMSRGSQKHQQQYQRGEDERRGRDEPFQNVLSGLDEEMLAEAFNIPVDVARKMQREDNRGFIVRLRDGWSLERPRGREEEREDSVSVPAAAAASAANDQQNPESLQGSICSARIQQNIDNPRDAYVYGKNAGRLNVANRQTLPILGLVRLSAEKLRLHPEALLAPQYSMHGHSVVYVTRGEARVQVSGTDGRLALDQTVRQGDMFVIPQYAVATARAERNGYESVSFKTTGQLSRSPLAGYASVMRGLPLPVLANAYGISTDEAEDLKQNRRHETLILSPSRRRRSSSP